MPLRRGARGSWVLGAGWFLECVVAPPLACAAAHRFAAKGIQPDVCELDAASSLRERLTGCGPPQRTETVLKPQQPVAVSRRLDPGFWMARSISKRGAPTWRHAYQLNPRHRPRFRHHGAVEAPKRIAFLLERSQAPTYRVAASSAVPPRQSPRSNPVNRVAWQPASDCAL